MQGTKESTGDDIWSDPPAVVQGELILFAGDVCAVPGSFLPDGSPIGVDLIGLRLVHFKQELIVQAVTIVNGLYRLVGRPHLRFPMLNGQFLKFSIRPNAELTFECNGSECGVSENFWSRPPNDTWPSKQSITRLQFRAHYQNVGMSLEIRGALEQPSNQSSAVSSDQPPPPKTFSVAGVLPWSVLPYLFGETPPFFEAHKSTVVSAPRS